MKIKIVVRPEDARKSDAAAENRPWMRQRRARWGLAALLGFVVLSAATAFFIVGRGTTPTDHEEQPLASAPAATGSGADQASTSEPAGSAPRHQDGDATGTAPEAAGAAPEAGSELATEEDTATPVPVGDGRGLPIAPAPPAAVGAPVDAVAGGAGALPRPAGPPPAGKPSPAAPADGATAPVVAKVPEKPERGVIRAQLASQVVSREPVDTLQSPVDVGAGGRDLYYFNEFRNLSGQTVTHRWEYNGRVVAAIPFRIEGNRWRVYSTKRIGENQRGDWRVSTVDKAGVVRARLDFRVE